MSDNSCTGFCPDCGWDLAFENFECSCKNPDCEWHCNDCSEKNKKDTGLE